jgi:CoA:oxalate CoA-transferase
MHGVTVQLSDTPNGIRLPPPSIGQHSDEVLRDWLGMSGDRLDALKRAKVI